MGASGIPRHPNDPMHPSIPGPPKTPTAGYGNCWPTWAGSPSIRVRSCESSSPNKTVNLPRSRLEFMIAFVPRELSGNSRASYLFRSAAETSIWDDAYLRKRTSIFAAVIESGLEGSCANIDICLIRKIRCSFIAPFGHTGACCPGSWPKVFIRTAK